MATILLIEDNPEIRENTGELLMLQGYSILEACDGLAGLDMARGHQPHIILCDIMIPELNGYEVLRQIREDPATARIPFIFLTARSERKNIEEGFSRGANGYIVKPFSAEDLYLEINKFF